MRMEPFVCCSIQEAQQDNFQKKIKGELSAYLKKATGINTDRNHYRSGGTGCRE